MIIFIFVFCLCVCKCTTWAWSPQWPEEGVRCCELALRRVVSHHVGYENRALGLFKSSEWSFLLPSHHQIQVVLLCLTLAMILFKLSTKLNPNFQTFIFSTCVLLYIFKIILAIKIVLSGHSCTLSAVASPGKVNNSSHYSEESVKMLASVATLILQENNKRKDRN